jgi:hypothetical protein
MYAGLSAERHHARYRVPISFAFGILKKSTEKVKDGIIGSLYLSSRAPVGRLN